MPEGTPLNARHLEWDTVPSLNVWVTSASFPLSTLRST